MVFLYDKYKIKDLNDIIFHKDFIDKLINDKNYDDIPNIFIYGRNGCGKKTIINLLLRKFYGENVNNTKKVIYPITEYGNIKTKVVPVNQSNYHIVIKPRNSGIDTYIIKEIVKEYAKKPLSHFIKTNVKFKTVLIYNIQNLSYYAQASLRRTMEKYAKFTKFILCGNQLSKIINPLRSRCLMIRTPSPTNSDIFKLVYTITIRENKMLSLNEYSNIVKKSERNANQAMWILEHVLNDVPFNLNWKNSLNEITKIILSIKKKKITVKMLDEIRTILYQIFTTNIPGIDVMIELSNQLLFEITDNDLKYIILNELSENERRISKGKRCVIHLEYFINNVMDIIYNYKIDSHIKT